MENIKHQIQDWLSEEGILQKSIPEKTSFFNFVVNFPHRSPFTINVVAPKDKIDLILLITRLGINPVHVNSLKSLKLDEREEFYWDLRFALLNLETEFNMKMEDGLLKYVELIIPIYKDGLSKNELFRMLRYMHKARLMIIWKFTQKFKGGEKSDHGAPMYI